MAGNVPEEQGLVPMLHQRWRDVAFIHWRYPPNVVDALLPPTLLPDVVVRPGPPLDDISTRDAQLVARWRAFTTHVGRLLEVPVEHPPWPVHEAELVRIDETLLAAAGLPPPEGAPIVHYSPGVTVKLGPPRLH